MSNFPGKGKVAVVKTSPDTILEDIDRLMVLAGVDQALPKGVTTGFKINISWQTWYPACSSTPWQIEGAIRTLKRLGYNDLLGIHNDTVVVDTSVGEFNNKHRFVTDSYKVPCLYLYEEQFDWIRYEPKRPFLVLDKVYPEGVYIPKALVGKNIVHLPTVKTHVFTTITGAMKNAFGGLLHRNRHWTHSVIHETLVDLLMIQQDIHPGIFAVMDGTFAGDGPVRVPCAGMKKTFCWHHLTRLLSMQFLPDCKGLILCRSQFIRLAHEMELGIGDPRQIEIVGYDIEQEQPWDFVQEDTFASRGQKMIYHGAVKTFRKTPPPEPIGAMELFCQQLLP